MEDCLFCKIAEKKINADIVAEDEKWLAFRDISPQAPVHILVIPKKHYNNIVEMNPASEFADLFTAVQVVAKQEGLDQAGFRLVANTGASAGQTVFHLHLHLLGQREMKWPPG